MSSTTTSPLTFAAAENTAEPRVESEAPSVTFAQIYDAYFAFVWRTARRLGIPQAALEDVTQEVFMVVHRRLGERPQGPTLHGWFYAIVLNVTRTYRRAARKAVPVVPGSADAVTGAVHPGPRPDESVARTEALGVLETLLGTLDEDKLEVFVLAELEQLQVKDIAALLGINVNTAHARLRAARQTLNEAIARSRARDAWRLR
jgi:RNA polymerase sigma-70 factor (ECF subfamily)